MKSSKFWLFCLLAFTMLVCIASDVHMLMKAMTNSDGNVIAVSVIGILICCAALVMNIISAVNAYKKSKDE
jgi:hypothetical protein